MREEKQKLQLPIRNHDDICESAEYSRHGDLLGSDIKRGLVVGASGCGKTNVMISLLEHQNGLRFENVYLYCKSLNQPKYQYLRTLLKPLKEIGYFEYANGDEIIAPGEIKSNSIIIFDDIVCCNQSIIRDYFCFGRHNKADCFYLCQTYSSIPKQLIRDNANFLIIFKQDNTNLKHIYDDHVNVDMSFQNFKDMCSYCWEDKYGFLVINKEFPLQRGRYRRGFDAYLYKE